MPTLETFLAVIKILLDVAEAYGQPHKDIRAGDLHTFIGGYPRDTKVLDSRRSDYYNISNPLIF